MSKSELKLAIRKLASSPDERYSLLCKVLSVDKDNATCEVSPLNASADIQNVRLNSLIGQKKGLLIFPKAGSTVTVSFYSKDQAYVSQYSDIDSFNIYIAEQKFELDEKGITAKSASADLTKSINKFIEVIDSVLSILTEFQVMTTYGPSLNVMPQIISKVISEKSKLSSIKSELNTILK
jgi:hypothetical protein